VDEGCAGWKGTHRVRLGSTAPHRLSAVERRKVHASDTRGEAAAAFSHAEPK
jgi:hypothetical protein